LFSLCPGGPVKPPVVISGGEVLMGKVAERKLLRSATAAQKEELGVVEVSRGQALLAADHFQIVAFLAKSLSDENRLRILGCVSHGKKSVSSIVEELGLSQPLVSHHLKELKRSLLVKIERSGPFIYYELSDPRIINVARMLSEVAGDLLSLRKTF
jgi:ArsR family transcriptional regulator, zinc-responsive transcriptional repressor